ncbi:MAG: hypothetical protein ACP5JH_09735 [Bacteroidota bacterium]
MTIEKILKEVIERLEKHKIEYMITGSFASNLHGVPRTTLDVDIVASSDFERLKNFIEEIQSGFYADLNMVKEAFEQRGMFNIIHYETGFKIDFIMKKKGHYYEKEFERRKTYTFADKLCFFASPEDTILSKLLWAKKGESERQFQDALGVAKIQGENLDHEYLQKWAEILGVKDMLERVIRELK